MNRQVPESCGRRQGGQGIAGKILRFESGEIVMRIEPPGDTAELDKSQRSRDDLQVHGTLVQL